MRQTRRLGGFVLRAAVPVLILAAVTALPAEAHHVMGGRTPSTFMGELLVALSVLISGGIIALGRSMRASWWVLLFAAGGLVHGYAFGESIFGAETSPLAAYLIGLIIVQGALATAVALVARRSVANAMQPRLAGAVIAGVGLAILAGQLLPA